MAKGLVAPAQAGAYGEAAGSRVAFNRCIRFKRMHASTRLRREERCGLRRSPRDSGTSVRDASGRRCRVRLHYPRQHDIKGCIGRFGPKSASGSATRIFRGCGSSYKIAKLLINHSSRARAMDVLNAMRAFERVAEAASFSRAAEQLNSSVPTITRLIGQLEEHLNVRLFQRTTRRISLTDAGATYLEGCKRALELIDETENQVSSASSALRGRLKVMSGSAVAFSHLAPVIADFVYRYPLIQLDFFTMDDGFNLVDEAVEVAILADYLIPTDTAVARHLITYSYVIAAAPRYLSQAGLVSTPSDLRKGVFLGRPGDRRGMSLRLSKGEGAQDDEVIDLVPRVICNNAQMLHELTLSGCGFSVLPQRLAQAAMASGQLVQLFPEYRLRDLNVDVCLVYPTRKRNSRIATVFIDHVIRWFDSPGDPAKT